MRSVLYRLSLKKEYAVIPHKANNCIPWKDNYLMLPRACEAYNILMLKEEIKIFVEVKNLNFYLTRVKISV